MGVPDRDRVTATAAALALLREIVAEHGPVLFHQSGGCCDGSSPMCYPREDFRIGAGDVLLGEVDGQPFFIGGRQLAAWGEDIALTLDAVAGRGGMFSLDNGRERRFLIRSAACLEGVRSAWHIRHPGLDPGSRCLVSVQEGGVRIEFGATERRDPGRSEASERDPVSPWYSAREPKPHV